MNILITAASRRVPLVQAFRQALSSLGVPGRVVVTDVNPLSPAVQVADRAYRVPLAHDSEYLPELLKICEAESIRLAVPTIDDEVELFGAARQTFADLGVFAACSSSRRRRPPATTSTPPGGCWPTTAFPPRARICRSSCRRSHDSRSSSSRVSAVGRSVRM